MESMKYWKHIKNSSMAYLAANLQEKVKDSLYMMNKYMGSIVSEDSESLKYSEINWNVSHLAHDSSYLPSFIVRLFWELIASNSQFVFNRPETHWHLAASWGASAKLSFSFYYLSENRVRQSALVKLVYPVLLSFRIKLSTLRVKKLREDLRNVASEKCLIFHRD